MESRACGPRVRRSAATAVLLLYVTASGAAASAPDASLRWAERLLNRASSPPTRSDGSDLPRRAAKDAEDAFRSVESKYGPDTRAAVGLAQSRLLLGNYNGAVRSLEQVLWASPLAPQERQRLSRQLDRARYLRRVADYAPRGLPKSHAILRIVPYSAARRRELFLVLSAEARYEDYWPEFRDIRLTLFEGSPLLLRSIWQSGKLGSSGYTDGTFSDVQLFLLDVTRDGVPDAVIPKTYVGASWAPSHLDVFTWRDGTMIKLLGVRSHLPVVLQDLNRDGRYEVKNFYAVGSDVCHAEQPYWSDIYACKRGHYELANGDFPREFRALYRDIRQKLRRYPNDTELPKYLGICYQIQRKPKLALNAYRLAERRQKARLASETDEECRTRLLGEIQDIRQRIRSLTRPSSAPRP